MQAAGQAGRFEGTFLDDFGKSPRGDKDNVQPRVGVVFDLRGDGRNLFRGGWGIYTDMAYTNANALTTSSSTTLARARLNVAATSGFITCSPAAGMRWRLVS